MKVETNSAMDRWNKILTTNPYDLNLEYHFTEKSKAVQGRIFSHPHDDWIESTSMQKKFGPYSCVHNAWKAKSHCRFLHGYGREVVITFKALETDENNWIFDYGSMEPFKKCLEWLLDHTCLVSDTCPYLDELEKLNEEHDVVNLRVHHSAYSSMEGQTYLVFLLLTAEMPHVLNAMKVLGEPERDVWISKVMMQEHDANRAVYSPRGRIVINF